jgi:hypothetical protein
MSFWNSSTGREYASSSMIRWQSRQVSCWVDCARAGDAAVANPVANRRRRSLAFTL